MQVNAYLRSAWGLSVNPVTITIIVRYEGLKGKEHKNTKSC